MIYVMSDIHGNRHRFESIMGQINLRAEDMLYVLGDVIDRYPDGIEILTQLMDMPNVKMLLGNHEHMMLNVLDPGILGTTKFARRLFVDPLSLWYANGGQETHERIKRIGKEDQQRMFAYLRSLPLNIDVEVNGQKFKLIHGAPVERFCDYHNDYPDVIDFSVWKRWMPDDPDVDDCILIFGHTPTIEFQEDVPMRIWHAPGDKRLGIDCGSGYPPISVRGKLIEYGRLSCLRLDDMKEYYSVDDLGIESDGSH